MTEYDKFIDTLNAIYNLDEQEKIFTFLNVIANLVYDDAFKVLQGATYTRNFTLGRLDISVNYRKENL